MKAAADPQLDPTLWTWHTGDGYKVALPAEWQPPKASDLAADISTLQNLQNPGAAYGLAPKKESVSGKADLVLDNKQYKALPGETPTRFTMTVTKKGGGADAKAEMQALKQSEYEMQHPEVTTLDLPVGKGYQVRHHWKNKTGDSVARVDIFLGDGERLFQMTFTAMDKQNIYDVSGYVAQSFRPVKA
ncbi:MAG: hypothetical protein JSS65_09835 [Armatimonadetes bacterium]|nr:hypothetical protein [Armatimonadota bacterium]